MTSKTVKIQNPSGLHIRPAGILCDTAMEFASRVTLLHKGNVEVNAKSVLSILGAAIRNGDEIDILCDGPDEEQALARLVEVIESGFVEKE